MSTQTVYPEIAILNRIADLVESGIDFPTALRMTANELSEYYKSHMGEEIVPFELGN